LRDRGVPLLPFLLVEPDGHIPRRDLDDAGWQEIVVKPLVGASAWQIMRARAADLKEALTPELRRTGYLIQPYACEVEQGEYSVIFCNGRFSHAILKKPRTGDFRTQPELGAVLSVVQPSDSLLADAAAVLQALPDVPTYARIDGIIQNGRFVLMEAELIEPELFFRLYPAGAPTFADSLLALRQSKGR
jgi:glutathione synthase/RimK-type ligase-like ATP-grasp enzyme